MTTKTVAELQTEVEARLKSIDDKLKNTPDRSGIKSDDGINSEGGWIDDVEEITVVTGHEGRGPQLTPQHGRYRTSRKSMLKSLHKQGYKPYGEFKSFGDLIRFGVENRNDKGKIQARVEKHYGESVKSIQGLTTTDGSDGGFTIMPEYAPTIYERMFDNNLWEKTDNYSVNGNGMTFLCSAETSRANGSRAGGMQGYWVSEGGTITKSKPTLREVNIKLGKLAIVVYLTDELMRDSSYAIEQRVARQAAAEFRFLMGDALFNGIASGGQPMGWFNSPNLVSVAKESGQDARTINTFNVENMYARFFAPYLPGAEWYHHQDIQPQLDTMTLGLGLGQVPVYMPPGNMSAAPYGALKGRPLQPTEFNATLGTQGDLALIDMGQMITISKGGVQQAVSMHIEFLTDQLALRFTLRCGGRPWENAPLTPYKGTNTQTSAVVLDTRS